MLTGVVQGSGWPASLGHQSDHWVLADAHLASQICRNLSCVSHIKVLVGPTPQQVIALQNLTDETMGLALLRSILPDFTRHALVGARYV